VPPDSSVPVTIVFTPMLVESANQVLPITSGDPKHLRVNLPVSGTVLAGKLSAPTKVVLAANAGSASTKTVILGNSGKGMLSGTVQSFEPGSALKLVGGPVSFTLGPGQKQSITIQFTPPSAGSVSANLAIDTSPPPGTTTIAVQGSVR